MHKGVELVKLRLYRARRFLLTQGARNGGCSLRAQEHRQISNFVRLHFSFHWNPWSIQKSDSFLIGHLKQWRIDDSMKGQRLMALRIAHTSTIALETSTHHEAFT